jgi:hypothetical protein
MKSKIPATITSDLKLDATHQQLEAWRSQAKHREPIPERIWKTATELARVHGISKVAQALRLNYTALKRRVSLVPVSSQSLPSFIELACAPVCPPGRCQIVMEDGVGGKMSLELPTTDLAVVRELALVFWRRTS